MTVRALIGRIGRVSAFRMNWMSRPWRPDELADAAGAFVLKYDYGV